MATNETVEAKQPAMTPLQEQRWLRMEPMRIGWLGMEWHHYEREIRLPFDEAIERGVLDRRYEFLFEDDAGLPQSTAQAGIDAFNRLVDALFDAKNPRTAGRELPRRVMTTLEAAVFVLVSAVVIVAGAFFASLRPCRTTSHQIATAPIT